MYFYFVVASDILIFLGTVFNFVFRLDEDHNISLDDATSVVGSLLSR